MNYFRMFDDCLMDTVRFVEDFGSPMQGETDIIVNVPGYGKDEIEILIEWDERFILVKCQKEGDQNAVYTRVCLASWVDPNTLTAKLSKGQLTIDCKKRDTKKVEIQGD